MQIVWFRRDLRLNDSEIVSRACRNGLLVLPCFVVDPWFYEQSDVAAARVKFLFESLENLDANLRSLGSRLYLFEGESVDVIGRLMRSLLELNQKPKLYFNRDVQVQYGIDRDHSIIDFYCSYNLESYIGTNHFLQPDNQHLDDWWQDYHDYQSQSTYPTPQEINTPELVFDIPQLTFAQLWQKYGQNQKSVANKFRGGEDQAQATLDSFLAHRYRGYHWKMSRPWLAQAGATSHLSPHFHFGTISTRTVYQKTNKLLEQQSNQSKARFSLKTILDRVRWHDKFTQRLYFYPQLATQNHYREFDEWYSPKALAGEKQELFQAWCEGKTGFPMVDASMRQLNQMGWTNFRMRAMCVTFLCVNCGVSWHHGAQYFLSRLVDGDIAINHWQ